MPKVRRFPANNFDLLRLLLAVGVMLHHLPVLTGQQAYQWLLRVGESTGMVHSFFVISGFLIFMSYERSKGLRHYFGNRVRRIYPAYVTVVLLCAVGGLLLTRLPALEYLRSGALRYLAANLCFLVFLQPKLPGVFEHNILQAVNGALWTLKIEVAFYLCVPLIGWLMRRYQRGLILALLYVASFAYAELSARYAGGVVAKQFPGQLCFFVVGISLYCYFDHFARHAALWFALAVGALYLERVFALDWLDAASVGVVTIYLAYFLPPVASAGRFGDLSYGIYIYHFPVIQLLANYGVYRWHPVAGFLLTLAITGVLAFASWHLIEKRFLRKSSHYRQAAEPALA